MRVLILGGDGYLGWPTAMRLSKAGHEVCVVDNYLRRSLSREHDVEALFVPPNLMERSRLWESVSGCTLDVRIGDCCDYSFLRQVFASFAPQAVIHYAEQPSAPYSMLNHQAAFVTLTNNLQATLNVIWAVRQEAPDCHIIKLGTMGEYGTPNIDIEEGWLDIEHNGRSDKFLYPRQASSLYHTTKIQDTDLLWFYTRMWGLRVTDLMQGPVYGLASDEIDLHESLGTYFNYDEIFGTVLNRFVVQAVAGHPLTVYGTGGQTRGYLDLRDTLACVEICLLNPSEEGQLTVFNQFVETFSVNNLAEKVERVGTARGHSVTVKKLENPRKEAGEHYYNPKHTGLLELGLEPHYLTDEALDDIFARVEKHTQNIDTHKIFRGVKW